MYFINSENSRQEFTQHSGVSKKVLLGNGFIPNLTGLSVSSLLVGQTIDFHAHQTMYEVFYVTQGVVLFTFEDRSFNVHSGECIVVEPGEVHALENKYDKITHFLYFGVAVD